MLSPPSTPPPLNNQENPTVHDNAENSPSTPTFEDESEMGTYEALKLPDISTSRFPLKTMTVSELWAMVLALKVKFKLSEGCLLALCQAFNSLASGNPLEKLPHSRKALSKALTEASNLKRTWITYCDECYNIVLEAEVKPTVATCQNCQKSLSQKLKDGRCSFITLSIRSQLKAYMENGLLPALRRNFLSLNWGRLQGAAHDAIVRADDLDLTIGCDAAQITRSSKIQIYPVILFINHVPVNYQSRFPILAALYCGPGNKKPPVQILMKKALEELRELEQTPLAYVPFLGQKEVEHRVYITICSADQPQRLEILNQKGGKFSCTYCYQEGVQLANSTRFTELITSRNIRGILYRSEESRIHIGKDVCKQIVEDGNFEPILGLRGMPTIFGFKHFEATWSCTSDPLHVIFEGVGKRLVEMMCKGKYDPKTNRYAIRSKEAPTFEGWFNVLHS